jgi:AraC-like DNA-binding protein
MKPVPLARGVILVPFVSILDGVGAPSGKLLGEFQLPTHPGGKSDDYMPLFPALRFITTAQLSQGIADFGFLAAHQMSFQTLSERMKTAICHSPSLLVALQHWCGLAQLEGNLMHSWLEYDEHVVRICSTLTGTAGMPHLEHSLVREFAGPQWAPVTFSFQARYTPSAATQAVWSNTRFLAGQKASWIDVPVSHLSLLKSTKVDAVDPQGQEFVPIGTDMITTLNLLLPAYLDARVPNIREVAEITGTSVRSLQRELALANLTFSDLVDQVRFRKSAELLRQQDIKIIDVAFATGYTDPAHFARAFRRIAGVTPREFRQSRRNSDNRRDSLPQ